MKLHCLSVKLLILDEPSAVLTDTEIDDLFVFIRQLKKTGVGIIYISHRMDELKRITDRITVMRDGQYVDTLETPTAEISEVIRLMVGRTIYEEPKYAAHPHQRVRSHWRQAGKHS